LALAFPLHPPGRPDRSRAVELAQAGTEVLVVNGAADPFGIPEAAGAVQVVVLPGGTPTLAGPGRAIPPLVRPLRLRARGPCTGLSGRACLRAAARCGAMISPPGSSSPVSSNTTTPLQSRVQPCSGWLATARAASRSTACASGHCGVCGHMAVPPGQVILWFFCVSAAGVATAQQGDRG